MADAVGSLTKIVDVALKIKKVVDTVRQNRKDCHHIRGRVERVRHTLSLCEGNSELMESPAVCAAVEALGEILGEALELVMGCQDETTAANAVCLCCTAGKLSKELSKVDRAISDLNSEATFAILVYHISRQTRDGACPAPPPSAETDVFSEWTSEVEHTPHHAHSPPSFEDNYDEMFINLRAGKHTSSGSEGQINEDMQWLIPDKKYFHGRLHLSPCCAPRNLLQEIAGIVVKIKVAVETVRQNKEECVEIGRRTSRVSVLLSRLEDTDIVKEAVVRTALEKLLETFRHAHTAVMACQRRSIIVYLCHSPFHPGKLSDELHLVLDQMVLDLDVLIDILPSVPERAP